jgi:hypothetical protein
VGAKVLDGLMANFYYLGLGVWRSITLLVPKAIEEFLSGGHSVVGYFKVAPRQIATFLLLLPVST